MPSVARISTPDHPLYSQTELLEHSRNLLRYARSFPPGPERNQHRQIALSLRALFRNREWLASHVLDDLRQFPDRADPLIVSEPIPARRIG